MIKLVGVFFRELSELSPSRNHHPWAGAGLSLRWKQIPLVAEASDFPVDNYQASDILEYCLMENSSGPKFYSLLSIYGYI